MTVDMLKKSAKSLLKGYWVRSLTAVMLAVGVSSFASILIQLVLTLTQTDFQSVVGQGLLYVGTILGVFLTAPIHLGYNRILWLKTVDETPSLIDVFYLFGNFKLLFKYLALYVIKTLIIAIPAAVLTAPLFVLTMLGEEMSFDILSALESGSLASLVFSLGSILLVFAGIVLFVIQLVRYSVCDFVFIKHSNQSIWFILRTCSKTCVPRFKLIFSLYFSFAGWLLVAMTGIGQLYTTPYFSATLACAARQFMAEDEYNAQQEIRGE